MQPHKILIEAGVWGKEGWQRDFKCDQMGKRLLVQHTQKKIFRRKQ